VTQLAKNHLWPDHLAASTVGVAVHRLTHGHPEATDFVLRKLREEPRLVDDPDELLRRDGPEPGAPVYHYLLRPFVRGLNASKHVDDALLEALITVSAARNRLEAQTLTALLPVPIGLDSVLFTSPTLWSPPSTSEDRRLHPLARYLGMRALAARPAHDPASWHVVIGDLRDNAGDDLAARLRHTRLLDEREAVAAELATLLPDLPTEEWLALFDAVVAEPDPHERHVEVVGGAGRAGTRDGHVFRLLGVVPAIDHDPCLTRAAVVEKLCAHAGHSLRQLADDAQDPAVLILRAQWYERHGRIRG
jgi:hypothetical protein